MLDYRKIFKNLLKSYNESSFDSFPLKPPLWKEGEYISRSLLFDVASQSSVASSAPRVVFYGYGLLPCMKASSPGELRPMPLAESGSCQTVGL
jgi:hypothetical protein